MYLKSLVLQGFKSFAQRVELIFPQGVTAIVGPNGSGKSNVSDAIRWVLGEQNIRSLRGAALQDVIFAGTHGRKPLGMAEVSLTLDNTDLALPLEYAEVTITRRTYRSGESEFFINRTPCRLRDIQELLMDTGLGRGTLSIIGQGEVDAILSVRAEERRALLEDAAGITRYRSKRRAALDRLTETEQDLVRVNDIIGEVERQLTPLEHEAKRASMYRELTSQLTKAETRLILHDWGVRKEACQATEARLAEAVDVLSRQRQQLAEVQAKRKEALTAVETIQAKVSAMQDTLAELERSAQQIDSRGNVLGERLTGLRTDEQRRLQSLENIKAERDEYNAGQAAAEERLASLQAEVDAAQQLVSESEKLLSAQREQIEEKEASLHKLRADAVARYQKAADAQSELRRTSQAIDETKAGLLRHGQALEQVEQRLDAANEERRVAQTEINALEEGKSNLTELHGEVTRGLEALEATRQKNNELLDELRGRLTGLRSQRDALRDLEASFEGFHEGVRACLRAKAPWQDGVYGAVGSLLNTEPALEIALEVALGAATQNIIVADEETAKAAIEYLKQRRAGRVTFLPLDSLRVATLPVPDERLMQDEEYVGIASDLVSYDAQIVRAVEYLLGRVLVTRTLTGAIRLNRRLPNVNRVVTLEGDLVLATGPITGGHRRGRRGSGILTRSRRLTELSSQVKKLEEELARITEQRQETDQAITHANAERLDIEGRLQSILKEISERERRRDILRERVQTLTEEYQRLEGEISQAQDVLGQLEEQNKAAAAQLSTIDTDKERHTSEVAGLEQELMSLRAAQDELEDERAAKRAAWADASARLQGTQSEIERAKETLARLEDALTVETEELNSVIRRIKETEQQRQESEAAAEQVRAQIEDQNKKLAQCRDALAEAQSQADQWTQAEEVARQHVDDAAETVHKIELGLERERAAYSQIEERLLEMDIAIPDDTQSTRVVEVEQLRAQATKLRRQIDAMGSVNVHALEEFGALKDRHAFLVTQRDDLVEAKTSIDEAIAEMDATSRERLKATFEAIQESLDVVFPRLFGGGKAKMEWTDPGNPLESGIEMIVQPPGKRPQPLLTLSGGERALSAASLLFSIMTVRPSPFFVLDEVDAALDEANVERFAELLKEYGEKNQIIVITHRQGTMERADALFGVTMERQGASQLVSLRMDDALPAVSP